jgi:DnaJ-class molecular chaperone
VDSNQDNSERGTGSQPLVETDATTMNPGDEVPPGSPASGENLCRACGGTGLNTDDEACPECGGTGRVIVAVSAGP